MHEAGGRCQLIELVKSMTVGPRDLDSNSTFINVNMKKYAH